MTKILPWCTGKTAYATKAEAIGRIKRQTKDKHRRRCNHNTSLTPYLCGSCHQWHVGGTGKTVKATDPFGRTIKKKHNMMPKEKGRGNPERPAD